VALFEIINDWLILRIGFRHFLYYNNGMNNAIRWLGNAGFEIRLGTITILVDPFLSRPKPVHLLFGRPSTDRKAIVKYIQGSDAVLVTHTHFDHFMDVPSIARQTGAQIYGSANTCILAERMGVENKQINPIKPNEPFTIESVQVTAFPAAHPWIPCYGPGRLQQHTNFPLRLRDYRMDACFSFLISHRDISILVWSSTQPEQAPRADGLICRAVSKKDWYAQILEAVQPAWILPSHWDDMFQPLGDPRRPFFAPPQGLAVIKRIGLDRFRESIHSVNPTCIALVPEIFHPYSLENLAEV